MSDKPVACRGLRESSPAGSDDNAPCRTARAAVFILSGRRNRHEGLRWKIGRI